jgi:hypothetical protein
MAACKIVSCQGCGQPTDNDDLHFCLECCDSYCGLASRDCYCSCSRVKRAAYDAVHGSGAYEREAGDYIVTTEDIRRVVAYAARGDA